MGHLYARFVPAPILSHRHGLASSLPLHRQHLAYPFDFSHWRPVPSRQRQEQKRRRFSSCFPSRSPSSARRRRRSPLSRQLVRRLLCPRKSIPSRRGRQGATRCWGQCGRCRKFARQKREHREHKYGEREHGRGKSRATRRRGNGGWSSTNWKERCPGAGKSDQQRIMSLCTATSLTFSRRALRRSSPIRQPRARPFPSCRAPTRPKISPSQHLPRSTLAALSPTSHSSAPSRSAPKCR